MKLSRLVFREIAYRKGGFALGVLSVTVAVGCLVGMRGMLRLHDLRTEEIVAAKEAQTRREMTQLEDDFRLAMRRLGYNVLVLHADEDASQLHVRDPQTTMPEEYAHRLGQAGIETLNHLLPVLQHRFTWPEFDRTVTLMGIRGQVPVVGKEQFLTPDGQQYRNPILAAVPDGAVDLGHDVAQALDLAPGQRVPIRGESFVVHRVFPRRGNADDNTVWMSLDRVQQWLGLEGRINGILALECVCETDALGRIVADVQAVLPDTQVFEFSSLVQARAQVRQRTAAAHQSLVEEELRNRQALRQQRANLTAAVVPIVIGAAAIWIMALAFGNVRDRRMEIGVLRSLGLRTSHILAVFLGKALLMGLVGALLGYAAGLLGGLWAEGAAPRGALQLFEPAVLGLILLLTPLAAALASWLPTLVAAQQDPALVLREP